MSSAYGYAAARLLELNWAVEFASQLVCSLDMAVDQLFPFDSYPVL